MTIPMPDMPGQQENPEVSGAEFPESSAETVSETEGGPDGGAVTEAETEAEAEVEAETETEAEADVKAKAEAETKTASAHSAAKSETVRASSTGFKALFKKELCDHLNSNRFFIIALMLFVVTTASLVGAISNLGSVVDATSDFNFLKLFTTSGNTVYSFSTFIAFLGPLVGITLGFDAINNERSDGTLIRLAAQPIYRDSIINAKFLAGTAAICVLCVTLSLYFTGAGMIKSGLVPGSEELARIICFTVLAIVYMAFWLGLSVFFSVVCRHSATAALAGLAIWLFLSLFMSLMAAGIANAIFPVDGIDGYANLLDNYNANMMLNRISPYYLFGEAASTILNPGTRTVGIITSAASVDRAVAGVLPLGQSLLLIWPHIVVMAALVIAAFAAAYIIFMKQEIRA